MGYKLCNAESAIATCDSYNYKPKLRRRKNNNHHHHQQQQHQQLKLRRFTYAELEDATNGFSPDALLGKGSHGAVYRAVLDSGSLVVAVKRPSTTATLAAENEIDILSRIQSRRIVNLIGYAVSDRVAESSKLLLLVVEYMPNGSLYDFIHKQPNNPPTWRTRVRIALQVAEAVRALHLSSPPVIHRDIKSSNVLLDRKCSARLSDFGLALCGLVEDVRVMSTPPAGTLGYLDPCYLSPGDVSAKSDVFSFGILLLEIISGRRAIDVNYSPPAIVEWALPLIKAGDYRGICDRRIRCIVDWTVIMELALLAARCVRSTAEKRPPVTEVVECIKTVYKRVKLMQAVPMWNNLRRRVRRVERSQPLSEMDGSDWEEQQQRVKTCKHGSRRSLSAGRTRKVSNVPSPKDKIGELVTRGEHRTARSKSKSVGSFREIIKVGPEAGDCEISVNHLVKKRERGQVTVKLSTVVRLSKSRSMSVLQSSKNVSYHGSSNIFKEVDVFPLLEKSNSTSTSKSTSPLQVDNKSII